METEEMLQKGKSPREVYLWMKEQGKALFFNELKNHFVFNGKKTTKVLCNLKAQGFIFASKRKYIDIDGNLGHIYGLNDSQVQQRVIEYQELKRISPTTHIRGRISKRVTKLFKELRERNIKESEDKDQPIEHYDVGLTTNELKAYIGDEKITPRKISKTCALLRKKGVLFASPFTLPKTNMSEKGDKGFVFSISKRGVWNGLARLMPKSVKESLETLNSYNSVLSSWELSHRTGITTENQNDWLKYRFAEKMHLVRYVVQDGITYYHNPNCPKEYVERTLKKYAQNTREWRYDNTLKGYAFEDRAVWTYCMYKKAKGYDIKLPEGFPKVIPNWLNEQERNKYKLEYKDENGYNRVEWKCSIFRLNREPVDFVLFLREKGSKEVHTYILTIKNDTTKRFGVKYYTSFVGCIQSGRTFNGSSIPNYKNCRPVFICNDTYGRQIYEFNSGFNDFGGQLGSIITENRLKEMMEEMGMKYPEEEHYQQAMEVKKAYDLYQNHEEVLLGKKTVFEILKEKGYQVKEDGVKKNEPTN
jgi:hypothetical protein